MIGRRPHAAFGNSTGDQQMLEYTGGGRRRAADDAGAARRCARASMPMARPKACQTRKVGTFTQALYDEAKKDGWTVISMKNDWKRIFAFE